MKVYVQDVKENDPVSSVFQVARKTTTVARNGKPFIALTLRDKTGELDARIWERVEELDPLFAKDDLIEIQGQAQSFQGHLQVKVDALTKLDPATQDAADFPPPPAATEAPAQARGGEGRFAGPIVELIDRIRDPHIKALLQTFTQDEAFLNRFKRAPAAKTIHHARHGGLAEHTLSVMRLAHRMADHYPMADRDLLVAGAFLHDLCKVDELRYDKATEYTDEGRLVGHLVMAAQLIREKTLGLPNFPRPLENHLVHIVLAHHGKMEYGSPRVPMTIEAMLVHAIDELDSQMAGWLEAMQRDPNDTWTDYQKLYDRNLFKGTVPTESGRAPVERRKKRPEVTTKPQGSKPPREPRAEHRTEARADATTLESAPGTEGESSAPDRDRKPRRERTERTEKSGKPEVKLTFKPFAALTPTESMPDEEEAPPASAAAETPAPEATVEVIATPSTESESTPS